MFTRYLSSLAGSVPSYPPSRRRSLLPIPRRTKHACESTVHKSCWSPTRAQAIAVTLHELATNAAKYGALSAAKGQIELKWSHEADGRLILLWTEMGGPAVPVQTPMRQGFGRRVIERMIGQLKGKTRFDWRAEGLVCEITLQA